MAILWKLGDPSFTLELVHTTKADLCAGVSEQSDQSVLESGFSLLQWSIDPDGHLVRANKNGTVEWYKDAGGPFTITLAATLLDECSDSSNESSSSESCIIRATERKAHDISFTWDPDGHLSKATECGGTYWYINNALATPLTVTPFTFVFPALQNDSEESNSSTESSSSSGVCLQKFPHLLFRDLRLTVDPDGHFLLIETGERTQVTCGTVTLPPESTCCEEMPDTICLDLTVLRNASGFDPICGVDSIVLYWDGGSLKKQCWIGTGIINCIDHYTAKLCCGCPGTEHDFVGFGFFVNGIRLNTTAAGPGCCPFGFTLIESWHVEWGGGPECCPPSGPTELRGVLSEC